MFCKKCGAQMDDNAKICPTCGAAVEEADVEVAPAANDAEKSSLATKCLIFGIIGLALAESGILGIIFSAIAKKFVKNYIAAYGVIDDARVRVGKILGTVGLIVGIVMTVVIAISIVVAIIAAIGAAVVATSGAIIL